MKYYLGRGFDIWYQKVWEKLGLVLIFIAVLTLLTFPGSYITYSLTLDWNVTQWLMALLIFGPVIAILGIGPIISSLVIWLKERR